MCNPYSFEQYDAAIGKYEAYPDCGHNLVYPALGLAGEAGELAEKVKKLWRNHGITDGRLPASMVEYHLQGIIKEAGDVLWYLNAIAREMGTTLAEIAQENVRKLTDRAARNVIKGEGDNR